MTVSGGDVQRVPAWGHVVATWLPRFVLLAAVWCLVAMVLTPFSSTVAHVGSAVFGIFNIPVAGNVFTAALLFVVGSALAVRKRAALWFVLVAFQVGWLVVASFVTVLRAWDVRALPDVHVDNRAEDVVFVLSVAMAFVMIVVLWRIRPLFPARLAPGSWKRCADRARHRRGDLRGGRDPADRGLPEQPERAAAQDPVADPHRDRPGAGH